MKVDSSNPIAARPLRPARPGERGGSGGFAAHLSAPASAGGGSGAAPLGGVGALLALQVVDPAAERRGRAIRRGGRLLDLLDEIRIGILSGALSPGTLAELAQTLGEARAEVDDPGLLGLLDEIELRAQVELAKHGALSASG